MRRVTVIFTSFLFTNTSNKASNRGTTYSCYNWSISICTLDGCKYIRNIWKSFIVGSRNISSKSIKWLTGRKSSRINSGNITYLISINNNISNIFYCMWLAAICVWSIRVTEANLSTRTCDISRFKYESWRSIVVWIWSSNNYRIGIWSSLIIESCPCSICRCCRNSWFSPIWLQWTSYARYFYFWIKRIIESAIFSVIIKTETINFFTIDIGSRTKGKFKFFFTFTTKSIGAVALSLSRSCIISLAIEFCISWRISKKILSCHLSIWRNIGTISHFPIIICIWNRSPRSRTTKISYFFLPLKCKLSCSRII